MSIHDLVYAVRIGHWATMARNENGVVVFFVLGATGLRIFNHWCIQMLPCPRISPFPGGPAIRCCCSTEVFCDRCRAHHRTNALLIIIN